VIRSLTAWVSARSARRRAANRAYADRAVRWWLEQHPGDWDGPQLGRATRLAPVPLYTALARAEADGHIRTHVRDGNRVWTALDPADDDTPRRTP
jgi:hypothetical protein